jgi:2-amino-4-hydroxy-6-hydroxymethyldihydropteridine diphosphokinase
VSDSTTERRDGSPESPGGWEPALMSAIWKPIYIAVGSNIQDPREQVLKAVETLRGISSQLRVIAVSRLYRTKPFGPVAQPDFVNGVVGALTQLEASVLLQKMQAVEVALGRPAKHEKWGPRVIDLDLLIYGRERRQDPGLTLPHPGIVERNFVLYPLADIAPDLDVPGLGRVAELKGRVAHTGIWPL